MAIKSKRWYASLIGLTFCVAGGADIILTAATANLTVGDVDFLCRWLPVTTNGSVVAR